jgi:hypothetical protein
MESGMRRPVANLLGVVGLAIILLIALFYAPVRDRRNFERYMEEIAAVEIGKTSMEDFRSRTTRAHIGNLNFGCEREDCSFSLRTDNKRLHQLRLAPLSTVQGGVTFKNGIASNIYIVFEIAEGSNPQNHIGMVVSQRADSSSCGPRYDVLRRHRGEVADGQWATVSMDSCASSKEREKALAMSGACLTKIGGCKTVEALNPGLFTP